MHQAVSIALLRANGDLYHTGRLIGRLTHPQCLSLCVLSAILLGILYLFFGAFPLVFENNHGFTLAQTVCPFQLRRYARSRDRGHLFHGALRWNGPWYRNRPANMGPFTQQASSEATGARGRF